MNNVFRYVVASLLLAAGLAGNADASVVIGGTRIVYPAQDKEVTIKLSNEGAAPALVQVWLDNGDEKSTPDSAKVPFTVAPPIFRMDPSMGQAIRVVYTGEPLPNDKETLFWVNVLEVPPKPENQEDRNLLQFAFRTRIKFFFRPAGLGDGAGGAPEKLTWKLTQGEAGKGVALKVDNPTPYYVNFAHVGLNVDGKSITGPGGMVPPKASTTFPVEELSSRPSGNVQAEFTTINDFGALQKVVRPIAP